MTSRATRRATRPQIAPFRTGEAHPAARSDNRLTQEEPP